MADRQFQMFRRKTNVHLVATLNLVHLSLLCDDLGKHTLTALLKQFDTNGVTVPLSGRLEYFIINSLLVF